MNNPLRALISVAVTVLGEFMLTSAPETVIVGIAPFSVSTSDKETTCSASYSPLTTWFCKTSTNHFVFWLYNVLVLHLELQTLVCWNKTVKGPFGSLDRRLVLLLQVLSVVNLDTQPQLQDLLERGQHL